eukprot:TRINITY_DN6953_c0_g2_i1.p1 TRINITY_DN6953_c0_g2~~TRINITY_DN6953_c0_g2_i1.p1  ORF type:complete len:2232 (-),score=517.81 TRINITY_DN6953_c0_g2_i1:53-6748(-)
MDKAVRDLLYDAKTALNTSTQTFAKGPPPAWWDQSMEQLDEAEKKAAKLQPHTAIEEVAQFLTHFGATRDRLRSDYIVKKLGREFDDLKYGAWSALSTAEATFRKGPPVAWFDQAMQELETASTKVQKLEDAKFASLPQRATALAEFETRKSTLQKAYREKVMARQLQDAIYEAKSKLSTAESTFAKGPPRAWWDEAMEALSVATTLFQEKVMDPRFSGIAERDTFAAEFERRKGSLQQQFREKALGQDLNEAISNVKSLLSSAESTFNRGPPKEWWTEAMEKLEEAEKVFEAKLKTRAADFSGLQTFAAFSLEFAQRREALHKLYREKALGQEVRELIHQAESKLRDAETTFARGPPKDWWEEAMVKLEEASASFQLLLLAKYSGLAEAEAFAADFYKRKSALQSLYREKAVAKDLEDAIHELNTKLVNAEQLFAKGPPRSWYDEAMAALEQADELFSQCLKNDRFSALSARDAYAKVYAERRSTLRTLYKEKTLTADLEEHVREVMSSLANAEQTFNKGPPREWWDEALALLDKAQEAAAAVERDPRFQGAPGRDAMLNTFAERAALLRTQYRERALTRELDTGASDVASLLSAAKEVFGRGPPREWWDEAMIKVAEVSTQAQKVRERARSFEVEHGAWAEVIFTAEKGARELREKYTQCTLEDDVNRCAQYAEALLSGAEQTAKKAPPTSWYDEALAELEKAREASKELLTGRLASSTRSIEFCAQFVERAATLRTACARGLTECAERDAMCEISSLLYTAETTFARGPPRSWYDESLLPLEKAQELLIVHQQSHARCTSEKFTAFVKECTTRRDKLLTAYRTATLEDDAQQLTQEIEGLLARAEESFKRGPPREFFDEAAALYQQAEEKLFGVPAALLSATKIASLSQSVPGRLAQFRVRYVAATLDIDAREATDRVGSALRDAMATFRKGPPREFYDEAMEKLESARTMLDFVLLKKDLAGHALVVNFVKEFEKTASELATIYSAQVTALDLNAAALEINSLLQEAEANLARGPPASFFDDAAVLYSDAQQRLTTLQCSPKFRGMAVLNAQTAPLMQRSTAFMKLYTEKTVKVEAERHARELLGKLTAAESKFKQGPPRAFYDESLGLLQDAKRDADALLSCTALQGIQSVPDCIAEFSRRAAALEKAFVAATAADDVAQVSAQVLSLVSRAQELVARTPPVEFADEALELFQNAEAAVGALAHSVLASSAEAGELARKFSSCAADFWKKYDQAISRVGEVKVNDIVSMIAKAQGLLDQDQPALAAEAAAKAADLLKAGAPNANLRAEGAPSDTHEKLNKLLTALGEKLVPAEQARCGVEPVREATVKLAACVSSYENTPGCSRLARTCSELQIQAQRAAAKMSENCLLAHTAAATAVLQELHSAEQKYVDTVLAAETIPLIRGVEGLLDTAVLCKLRGGKLDEGAEKAFSQALELAQPALPEESLYRRVPAVAATVKRLASVAQVHLHRDIFAEIREKAAKASGAKAKPAAKAGVTALATKLAPPPKVMPSLPVVDITPDLKASLFKTLRVYNNQATNVNKRVTEALKNVASFPWDAVPYEEAPHPPESGLARYPVEAVKLELDYLTVYGPNRSLSELKDAAPDYPLVVSLWQAFDTFRLLWEQLLQHWKKLGEIAVEMYCVERDVKSLEARLENYTITTGTCPCFVGDHLPDCEAMLQVLNNTCDMQKRLEAEAARFGEPLPNSVALWASRLERLIVESKARHARHCVREIMGNHGQKDRSVVNSYLQGLGRFPAALDHVRGLWSEYTRTLLETRPEELAKDQYADLPVSLVEEARERPPIGEDPAVFAPAAQSIQPGTPQQTGLPAQSPETLLCDNVLLRDHNRERYGQIVFCTGDEAVPEYMTPEEAARFGSQQKRTLQYDEAISARAFWGPHCLRDLPLGEQLPEGPQRKPVYGPARLGNHYLELLLLVFIDGKRISCKAQPAGSTAHITQRETPPAHSNNIDYWGAARSVPLHVLDPHLDNLTSPWRIGAQRIGRDLLRGRPVAGGVRRLRLELRYRLTQSHENYTAFKRQAPLFNTPVSHPIAVGEIDVLVPGNAVLHSPLPLRQSVEPRAAEYEQLIMEYLRKANDWGGRGRHTEQVLHAALRGRMRVVSTHKYCVKIKHDSIEVREEPTQYGVDVQVAFYRSPETGWPREQIAVFSFIAAAPETAGCSEGHEPAASFPPVGGIFVGWSDTYEPSLLPEAVLTRIRRCPQQLQWVDYN